MAINYTWSIVQIDTLPELDGKKDVVSMVHWELSGEDAGLTGTIRGAHALTFKADGTFVPYSSLTKDEVVEWVKDTMGADAVASAEADVAQQIINKATAPVATALPWA